MTRGVALTVLLGAAVLEAGGDALMRTALSSPTPFRRAACFGLGALVLTAYGYAVNAPAWDFGRLLGIYVVMFFLVAQAIAYLAFGQKPTASVLIGGACIVLGGLIIARG